ncbi:MAG: YfaZ family outer membrane protein [Gammaproteobacteria bacterium]
MCSYRYLFLSFGLLCSGSVNALPSEQWQFVLTPVLWNASVSAKLSDENSGGGEPIRPDYNFFSLDNLDDYLSLKFAAKHGRFALLFDSLRARYQDETATNPVNLNIATDLGFVELAASYQLFDKHKLDLFGGVRRTFLDIDVIMSPFIDNKSSYSWTDPLIGLRYNYSFTKKWQLWLRGDVGGFDVATQRTVNATADIQYIINRYVSTTVGYRYLQIDFKEDDILYDVNLKGVYLGVGIHF